MMLELAEQSTYLTTYPAVAARFVAVFHSIEQLDISDERKGERLAIANSTACAALVLASKLEEAKALHMRHPVFARKDAILRRGSFAGYAEFYFAVTDIFLAGVGGTPPDPRWIPVFEKQPDWKMDDAARREFDAFRDFARGILAASGGNAMEGARLVKHAAWERIHSYDVALRRGFEGFPLPSMLDQIILALGLSVATRVKEQDGPELMLAGSELVNRSLHHGVVDAAVLLDSQSDQATRHDAHEYIQLLRRKRAWELDQISHMLNEDSPSGEDRGSTLRHYSEMAAKLDRLKDVLRRNPRLMPAKGLPTIGDLSRSLAPGSAYVTYFLAPPSFGKLCITRDGAYWALGTFGPQTASDVKLLAFATTASYPPNPRLDAQFPVSSALRLHDLLFGGLGGCLRPGMHVTVSLPTMFPGIPLGALLQQEPPRSGDGYELAKAHWMIRDFSFALVHSAREFLATTSYLRTSLARRPYLGIGDPKLDRPQLAKVASKATFRGTAVAPNGLADLRELPETAEELKSVGALFESADILIGEGATEAALRAKPLADYAVIHFATHGLIRDELTGLTEPALVLTPSGSADAKRDGLLLASEIFDLTLNARLVVLSACNTAKYDLGQATLVAQDLRTAFTVAGAPTLLVSLWPVDSATSRDLIVGFFRQWRSPQGAGAADALARATRAYLAQADAPHQHPRFWAPFVVAGNGGVRGLPDVPASASARRGQGVGRQ
jgi:hypothetical protein